MGLVVLVATATLACSSGDVGASGATSAAGAAGYGGAGASAGGSGRGGATTAAGGAGAGGATHAGGAHQGGASAGGAGSGGTTIAGGAGQGGSGGAGGAGQGGAGGAGVVCPAPGAPDCSPGSGTGDANQCFDAPSCFLQIVQDAIQKVIHTTHPEWVDWSDGQPRILDANQNDYVLAVVDEVASHDLCAIQDPNAGDEIVVKHDDAFAENFDILTADGHARYGGGIHTATCAPSWF
jgi:hypothetical protein